MQKSILKFTKMTRSPYQNLIKATDAIGVGIALLGFGMTAQAQAAQTAQTISFAQLPNKPYDAATFSVSASSSAGLPVSFTSTTPAICGVTASGSELWLIVPAGATWPQPGSICTIAANQAGNASVSAAPPVRRGRPTTVRHRT